MTGTVIFFIVFLVFLLFVSFGWGILGIKTCDTSGALKYIVHTVVYLLCSLLIENILWKIESMPVETVNGSSFSILTGKMFFISEIVFGLSAVMAVCQNLVNYLKEKNDTK